LYICESYAPNYGGGAAIYVKDVCKFLSQRGHEVRVITTEKNDSEPYTVRTEKIGDITISRINLPYFRTSDPEGWQLGTKKWKEHDQLISQIIDKYLNKWTPDIINYNAARPLGEELFFTISNRLIPMIALLHEGWLICLRLMFLQSPLEEACSGPGKLKCLECMYSHYDGSHAKAFLKLPWRIAKFGSYFAYRWQQRKEAAQTLKGAIAYSKFMQQLHLPHLNGSVKHIPLGLDLTELPIERPLRPRKPLCFGFIGGSQPNKGLSHILDSTVSLKNEGLQFKIKVWGNSQIECEKEIKARNLEDCVTLGGTYQSHQLWEVYNEMDVALMATVVSEPFGRVPIEAAAVGAITIAPEIGGITESIRDEIDGLTYRFREAKDLERQMRRILTKPGLYERLQANLHPVIHTQEAVKEVENFYYEILETKT
jgi:glycosyltransferase involved in cell wall biosynthesis